jgi:hypothetical protein
VLGLRGSQERDDTEGSAVVAGIGETGLRRSGATTHGFDEEVQQRLLAFLDESLKVVEPQGRRVDQM